MKNKTLIYVGLGLVAAGIIIYMVYFRKKKTAPTAPGQIAPASDIDWATLERTFATNNPFNNDKVRKIEEVAAIGETDPAPHPNEPDKVKIKITKTQFDQRVFQDIQRLIREKNESIREVKSKLSDWWEPWSRAGVNDSLARAIAYNTRTYFATNFYYDDASTPTNTVTAPGAVTTPQTPTNSVTGLTSQRYSY